MLCPECCHVVILTGELVLDKGASVLCYECSHAVFVTQDLGLLLLS